MLFFFCAMPSPLRSVCDRLNVLHTVTYVRLQLPHILFKLDLTAAAAVGLNTFQKHNISQLFRRSKLN